MNTFLHKKLSNVIRCEAEYTMANEKDIKIKSDKMNTLFNMQKIIDNYDELEPLLTEYFLKKAEKEKWER